jgi:hypothetical protein
MNPRLRAAVCGVALATLVVASPWSAAHGGQRTGGTVLAGPSAAAAPDTTAPMLESFSFVPGYAMHTFQYSATDNSNALGGLVFEFSDLALGRTLEIAWQLGPVVPLADTFYQFVRDDWQSGTYQLSRIDVSDPSGNIASYLRDGTVSLRPAGVAGPTGHAFDFSSVILHVAEVVTNPSAPGPPTATAGDRSAQVSWGAARPNGSPVTGYTVTSTPAGYGCTTAGATDCTVSGLTNGITYTFTVTATNAVSTGPASAPSNSVVPAGAPAASSRVVAYPGGDGAAQVTWYAADANGSPVTGYTVTSQPGARTCSTAGASAPPPPQTVVLDCRVAGLTNGTAYTFTVTATNTVGTSPASAPSNSVTPVAPPVPVVDRVAVVGTDDALWVRGSDSTRWRSLSGVLIDTPAVVVNGSTTFYVALGSDRNVWVRTDTLNWQPLGPTGTNCASPSAAVSRGTLAVGCTGGDSALWVSKTVLPTTGLPKLPRWSSRGGILKTGPSLSDASTTSTPAFGYAVVGADSRPWFRTDAVNWTIRSSAMCGGAVASSQRAEALACKDYASASLKTFHAPSQPGASLLTSEIINGAIQGRPAVTAAPDGSARYYVLGSDGTIWTATQAANGTLSGFAYWHGAGKHGIGATSIS